MWPKNAILGNGDWVFKFQYTYFQVQYLITKWSFDVICSYHNVINISISGNHRVQILKKTVHLTNYKFGVTDF